VRRLGWVALAVLAVALAIAAAVLRPADSQAGSAGGRPLVLAAASLSEVLPRISADARASFGGSNQLAQQIRQGAPFDVFLSASPRYTQELYAEGLVRKPVAFATNSLVLIVPRANPARIRSVADLARPGRLRLVVAGPAVPIGLYTREVLERMGLLRVLRKAVSLEPDVKGIVGKVALGEADAGFVYATDVAPVRSKVRAIPIPARAQPTVRYELAVAAQPLDLEAAQELVIAILGPDGRRALRAAGFGQT
jgi:molybdate transport system substrate-binding protein